MSDAFTRVEFHVVTTYEQDGKGMVEVEMDTEPCPFVHLMMAAEYLGHLAAQQSNAGYERALELIVQGAMQYRKAPGGS